MAFESRGRVERGRLPHDGRRPRPAPCSAAPRPSAPSSPAPTTAPSTPCADYGAHLGLAFQAVDDLLGDLGRAGRHRQAGRTDLRLARRRRSPSRWPWPPTPTAAAELRALFGNGQLDAAARWPRATALIEARRRPGGHRRRWPASTSPPPWPPSRPRPARPAGGRRAGRRWPTTSATGSDDDDRRRRPRAGSPHGRSARPAPLDADAVRPSADPQAALDRGAAALLAPSTPTAGGRASSRPTSRWTPRTCCCASSSASSTAEPSQRTADVDPRRSSATTAPGPPSTAAPPTSRPRSRPTSPCAWPATRPTPPTCRRRPRSSATPAASSGTRVFTRIWLALFGVWSWDDLPALPPEVMLLPPWCPLNIYDFACWARQTIVPLTVVAAHRPVRPLPFDARRAAHRRCRRGRATRSRTTAGRFELLDRVLHRYERRPPRPAAAAGPATGPRLDRRPPGGRRLVGRHPAAVGVLADRPAPAGFPLDHPAMQAGLRRPRPLHRRRRARPAPRGAASRRCGTPRWP